VLDVAFLALTLAILAGFGLFAKAVESL